MQYLVQCSCGQHMTVDDSQAGMQFGCSGCRQPFSVPANPTGAQVVAISPALRAPSPIPHQPAPAHYQPQGHVYVTTPPKSPGVAAVLSFFYCGLGQIYNGEIGKGIGFLIGYSFCWLLCFILIGFILVPIFWVIGMIDAYTSAERINRSHANQMFGGGPVY